MSQLFYKHSKGWLVIVWALLFTIFALTVLPGQSAQTETYSAGTGAPDTSLFYTPDDLLNMAEAYGSPGRRAYVHARFTFDLVFPLVYTFFLTTSITWLLERVLAIDSPWRFLNLLPFFAMLLDFLENICTAWVITVYPAQNPVIALLASIFSPLKWLFVGASFTVLLVSVVLFLWKSIFSQKL